MLLATILGTLSLVAGGLLLLLRETSSGMHLLQNLVLLGAIATGTVFASKRLLTSERPITRTTPGPVPSIAVSNGQKVGRAFSGVVATLGVVFGFIASFVLLFLGIGVPELLALAAAFLFINISWAFAVASMFEYEHHFLGMIASPLAPVLCLLLVILFSAFEPFFLK